MNEPASHGDGRPVAGNKVDEQSSKSPKDTGPTSAEQLASPPSDKGRGQSLPFHVAIADGGLEITARTKNEEDVDNLIHILQTIKPLLRDIYGKQPSALDDPPDPPGIEANAQHTFKAAMTAHKGAETGMSFIITKAQKDELLRRGYSEEQIREMKPEDAHRILGLIS
jgi:hypothetical protein